MPSWSTAAAEWVRHLFTQRDREPPPPPGAAPTVAIGAHALLAVESSLAQSIHHTSPRGQAADRPDPRGMTNVFGERVEEHFVESPRGALAGASGAALAGLRASAFLPGDRLTQVYEQLAFAAGRRLPLVVHVAAKAMASHAKSAGSGHAAYHAIAGSQALICMARDLQHALDLSLAARRAAELTLTPVVIAVDDLELWKSLQTVQLPAPELIRSYLGPAEDETDTSPAQSLLLGPRRRTVPRWFDLQAPAAHGVLVGGRAFGAGVAGQDIFFAQPAREQCERAMRELSERTGRGLDWVSRHRVKDARYVILAQGSVLPLAEAVADHLRRVHRLAVGVLGLTWLRPFPAEALQTALRRAEVVTVLERAEDALAERGPLLTEVTADLAGLGPQLLSAAYGVGGAPLRAGDLVAVFENMREGRKPRLRLGIDAPGRSRFPRRQVRMEAVGRAFPEMSKTVIEAQEDVDTRVTGARTAILITTSPSPPERLLLQFGEAMRTDERPYVHCRCRSDEPGVWTAMATAAASPVSDPGDATLVDVLLVASLDVTASLHPLGRLRDGAAVVIASHLADDELVDVVPEAWHADLSRLTLYATHARAERLIATAAGLLVGSDDGLEPIPFSPPPSAPIEATLPAAFAERAPRASERYDNLPSFFAEQWQPHQGAEAGSAVPDPAVSLGALPAGTAALHDLSAGRRQAPRLEPSLCTGCAACLSACPHSAIAATLITTRGLLEATVQRDSKLSRALPQIAGRAEREMKQGRARTLSKAGLHAAFESVVERLGLDGEARQAADDTIGRALARIAEIPIAVTDGFFYDRDKDARELFAIAVNPQACQSCEACATACEPNAIAVMPQTPATLARMKDSWQAFDALPDSPGASIAKARSELGPLHAVLLSKHCQLAMSGGDRAEPGSGERLGTRLLIAVAEYQVQQRQLELTTLFKKRAEALREQIDRGLSLAVKRYDLGHLDVALSRGGPNQLEDLAAEMNSLGEHTEIDRSRLLALVRATKELEGATTRLATGTGRARYGIVVAGETIAEWAARFPVNPFWAPTVVDLAGSGADLAVGLAAGLSRQRVDECRFLRWTERLLEGTPDDATREAELDRLSWAELTDEEKGHGSPLLILAGSEILAHRGQAGLSRLLSSSWPAKLVLFDAGDRLGGAVDPVMFALAHRHAYVASTSIAHPDHLFEAASAALVHPGPALLHVHAPSPSRQGFATDQTLARARLAVQSRLQPLLTYDPGREGVFCQRLSLDGNADPEADWTTSMDRFGQALTPAHWAMGATAFLDDLPKSDRIGVPVGDWARLPPEQRLTVTPTLDSADGQHHGLSPRLAAAVAERLELWTVLRELAGLRTPFGAGVREAIEAELNALHAAELRAQSARHEDEMAAVAAAQRTEAAAQLHQRLVELVRRAPERVDERDAPAGAQP